MAHYSAIMCFSSFFLSADLKFILFPPHRSKCGTTIPLMLEESINE